MSGTTQRSNAAVGKATRNAPEKSQIAEAGSAPGGHGEDAGGDVQLLRSQNELAGVLEGTAERESRLATEEVAATQTREARKGNTETVIFAATGHFVLKGAGKKKDEWDEWEEVPPIMLDFAAGDGAVHTSDAKVIQLAKDAVSGKLGRDKQTEAQKVGLRVIAPAAPLPPFGTWDELPAGQVLEASRMTGAIRTKHDVQDALDYELSKPEPGNDVDPGTRTQRPDLVAALEALLHVGADRPLAESGAHAAGVSMAL